MRNINVNEHTEKKGQLTYLSWAWAWDTVLQLDPDATWEAKEYKTASGNTVPCMFFPDHTAMVCVSVSIKGKTKSCVLPVMDNRNKAIVDPNAFAINTAIMRCMTKAVSMFGLGLYIYAGEDLPSDSVEEKIIKLENVIIPASPRTDDLGLDAEQIQWLEEFAHVVRTAIATDGPRAALNMIQAAGLDNEQRIALNNMLDSKVRAALKKAREEV